MKRRIKCLATVIKRLKVNYMIYARTRSLPPTTSFVLPNRLKSGNCGEPTTVTITTILRTECIYKLLHPEGEKKKGNTYTYYIIIAFYIHLIIYRNINIFFCWVTKICFLCRYIYALQCCPYII